MDKLYVIYSKSDKNEVNSILDEIRDYIHDNIMCLEDDNDIDLENGNFPNVDASTAILVANSPQLEKDELANKVIAYIKNTNRAVISIAINGYVSNHFDFRSKIYDLTNRDDRNDFYRSISGLFHVTVEAGDAYGILVKIKTDASAKLYKNEEFICDLIAGQEKSVRMDEGKHVLKYVDVDNPNIFWGYTLNDIPTVKDGQKVIELNNVQLKKEFDAIKKDLREREMEIKQTNEFRTKVTKRADRMKYYILGIAIFSALIGYFGWYLPYKKDRDAERTYVYASSLILRSEKLAGVEYNKIGNLLYGTELITYSRDEEWAEVKANGKEGFVSSKFLLNKSQFDILSKIWGDYESQNTITSTKCRNALMDFCNNRSNEGWQVFSRGVKTKPNFMFYPRVYNKLSKFTDFFCVLKNGAGDLKMIAYSFDDETEVPIFRTAFNIEGTGLIESISLDKTVENLIVIKMADGYKYQYLRDE